MEEKDVDRPSVVVARQIVNLYAPGELGLQNRLVQEFDNYEAARSSRRLCSGAEMNTVMLFAMFAFGYLLGFASGYAVKKSEVDEVK